MICTLRKEQCIVSKKIRGINQSTAGSLKSFYLFTANKRKFAYKTLNVFKVNLGYIVIFKEYMLDKATKELKDTNRYKILFPAWGGSQKSFNDAYESIKSMYIRAYLTHVSGENIKVHAGMWEMINRWYSEVGDIIRNIPKDADIYVVGCSLGGGMANVGALKLVLEGITVKEKLHLYAFGAPRIGNKECGDAIIAGVSDDSYNFVRLNNMILKNNILYTQFDFVSKMPPIEKCLTVDCKFVDNPKIRCMSSGFFFDPVLGTFDTQPEFSMSLKTNVASRFPNIVKYGPPISWHNCGRLAPINHSLTIYAQYPFAGILTDTSIFPSENVFIEKNDCV